ncbi:MAG: zinc metalloprotease HtpX [Pseudomonadota bacterium]
MTPLADHRLRNFVHSALLLGGMALITWISIAASIGPAAGLWALAGIGFGLAIAPRAPKSWTLALYRARPVSEQSFPAGIGMVRQLARDAELPRVPALFYIPSSVPNAFAVGSAHDSAIAVSDGLLRRLNRRELFGVLAHEVSHVANRDLWLMSLADVMARMTGLACFVGLVLLMLNLPLVLMGVAPVSWLAIAVMILSPTVISLMQLGLSRSREFDADLTAARLTGDPAGLASALEKIAGRPGGLWASIFMPVQRTPDPSLLRTHPPTEERIRRLSALVPRQPVPETVIAEPGFSGPIIVGRPRWHRTGVWF